MALHGHTTIELTNVETGEKRVVEDNNMVTNALQELFRPIALGNSYSKLFSGSTDDVTGFTGERRSVCLSTGGLLLFDNAIEENPNNFLPPDNAEVVGVGTTKVYSGNNTMVGSYNFKESGLIENGYKHVWDFGTSYGNGQIACACLTTRDGGYAGVGTYPFSSDFYRDYNANSSIAHQLNSNLDYIQFDKNLKFCLIFDYEKNLMIELYNTKYASGIFSTNTIRTSPTADHDMLVNKKAKFNFRRMPFTNISMFDTGGTGSIGLKLIKTVEVEMPDSLKNVIDEYIAQSGKYIRYSYSSDNKDYVYLIFSLAHNSTAAGYQNLSAKEILHVWKININDFTSEHIQVVNTLNKNMIVYYNGLPTIYITNGQMLVRAGETLYLISLSDSTNVKEVILPSGGTLKASSFNSNRCYRIGNKLHFTLTNTSNYSVVLNLDTGVAKYRNVTAKYEVEYFDAVNSPSLVGIYPVSERSGLIVMVKYRNNSNFSISTRYLPDVLVTINNLDSPVTKTAAETMKVTYTLTQDLDV